MENINRQSFHSSFEFQYTYQKIPARIVSNEGVFVLNKQRRHKTKFGFVRFYGDRFAVKFIRKKFIGNAMYEIDENILLSESLQNLQESKCNQYIMELLYVETNSQYIMLVFNALAQDLISFINSRPGFSFETAIRLIHDVSFALLCLWEMNFVYGDVKPDNILVNPDNAGEKSRVISNQFVLTDFDTLKIKNNNGLTIEDGYTTGFRSLNRIKNYTISIQDDVWSLSIVLFIFIVRKQSMFQVEEDFTKDTQNKAVQEIKESAKQMNWTNRQITKIVKLFSVMNEYNESKRINIEKLVKMTQMK
jgi:serine/threonine protein kinase